MRALGERKPLNILFVLMAIAALLGVFWNPLLNIVSQVVAPLVLAGLSVVSFLLGKKSLKWSRRFPLNVDDLKCRSIVAAVDAQDIIAFTDPNGLIVDVNDNFCRVSKYSREELIGKRHSILKSGHHSEAFYRNLWLTINSGRTWRGRFCNRAKDGSLYWVDSIIIPQVSPLGEITGYMSLRHDVTEQMMLIEESKKNQARLEALIEYSPIGVVETDTKGHIVRVNKSFCQIVGCYEKEILGRTLSSFVHPEDLGDQELKDSLLDSSGYIQRVRKRYLKKNGTTTWVRVSSNHLPNGHLISTIEDIQPLYEREISIHRYYEQFEKIFSLSTDMIAVNSIDGRLIHANRSYLNVLGFSLEDLQKINILDRVHPADQEAEGCRWQSLVSGQAIQWESRVKTSQGDYKLILWNAVPDVMNELVYSIGRDISEIRENELKAMNASKMLGLSQISAGVAHEINNPLTIIRGRVELIKKQVSRDAPDVMKIKNYLENADEMVTRIASIVDALKIFSSSPNTVHSAMEVQEETSAAFIVEKSIAFFKERAAKNSIRIDLKLKNGDFNFSCRTREISHIFNIIIANSIEAIQNCPEPWIEITAEKQTDHVRISFSDSGKGICDAVAERIMEPFFSTKGISSGLGLSIAKGLIEGHGGTLDLDRTQSFTTFVLKIPYPKAQKTIEVIRSAR